MYIKDFAAAPKLALARHIHFRVTTGHENLGHANMARVNQLNPREQPDLVAAANERQQDGVATPLHDTQGHANAGALPCHPRDDASMEPSSRRRYSGTVRGKQNDLRKEDLATKCVCISLDLGGDLPSDSHRRRLRGNRAGAPRLLSLPD